MHAGSTRLLLNVFIFGSMLRLIGLARYSLWVDEAATWAAATRATLGEAVFADGNHPPVWTLVTRLWIAIGGDSERALRTPAALFGILAAVLAWRLALRLLDPARAPARGDFRREDDGGRGAAAAAWLGALAALNPFWLEYAQEARMYSALLAETLGLTLLYVTWLHRPRRLLLVAYAVLAGVSLYTHYFAAWPIAAHGLHALWSARRSRGTEAAFSPQPFLVAQVAGVLLFLPWVIRLLGGAASVAPGETYEPFGRLAHALWRMGAGPGIVALDRPRVVAGPAAVFAEQPVLVVVTAILWGLPVLLGIRALWSRGASGRLVLLLAAVPVAAVLLAFPVAPLIHEKYLIVAAPFVLLLAVVGAWSVRGLVRIVLLTGLALLHVAGLAAVQASNEPHVVDVLSAGHPYGKEEWRAAREWVARRAQEGDVVIVPLLPPPADPRLTRFAWEYYDRDRLATVYLGSVPATPEELRARVPGVATAKRVYLVLSHEAMDDRGHWVALLLADHGKFEERLFPRSWGVLVDEFARD